MAARRSRGQVSSPATGSATSTPKPGRRLTPASATPTKRKAVTAPPKAKGGAKDSKKRKVVKEEDDEEAEDPPTPSENTSSSDDDSEDAFDPESSGSDEEVAEDEEESEVDSDFLDEDEDEQKKRKSGGGVSSRPAQKARPSNGKGKQAVKVDDDDEDEDADASEVELEEGQVIAGRIYPAPTTGKGRLRGIGDYQTNQIVPPGRISRNTFKFLKNLQIPEKNNRDWFRSHEPSFRQAENVSQELDRLT
jgi:hypothetical protein